MGGIFLVICRYRTGFHLLGWPLHCLLSALANVVVPLEFLFVPLHWNWFRFCAGFFVGISLRLPPTVQCSSRDTDDKCRSTFCVYDHSVVCHIFDLLVFSMDGIFLVHKNIGTTTTSASAARNNNNN
mmetsp:Transcript_41432/g.47819  ORF Transcript_41432/g.47819 Transcript_41432/m.47819 type:complete len:127 (+) Transcript_41432:1102-1482(+)